MFRRSKRNLFVAFSVLLITATIILIASNHNAIHSLSEYLQTTQFNSTTKFKANNVECIKEDVESYLLQQAVCPAKDPFHDLRDAIEYVESKDTPQTKSSSEKVQTIGDFYAANIDGNLTTLDKFNLAISRNELYAEDSELVDELLQDMATRKIVRVYEKSGGTQLKFKLKFDNGMFAIAKPMRVSREQQALPNQIHYAEFERHNSEIAAYHLDRILKFRRTMPVIGRVLNVTSEIYELANENLTDTFYMSPDNNLCFYGNCEQYCDINHPICANAGQIEVALISFLPTYFDIDIDEKKSPWRKSYDRTKKAIWQHDPQYCETVKLKEDYREGRQMLDVMDQILFDFLTGNKDRHHFAYFKGFRGATFMLNYDNGRGFGHPFYDEELNLIPLQQCCVLRASTLKTLLSFHNGPTPLSQLMRESMASDPINSIAPVLWEPHLIALDRRVEIILNVFRNCIQNKPIEDVIFTRKFFTQAASDY